MSLMSLLIDQLWGTWGYIPGKISNFCGAFGQYAPQKFFSNFKKKTPARSGQRWCSPEVGVADGGEKEVTGGCGGGRRWRRGGGHWRRRRPPEEEEEKVTGGGARRGGGGRWEEEEELTK